MTGSAGLMDVSVEIICSICTKAIEGILVKFTEMGETGVGEYLER